MRSAFSQLLISFSTSISLPLNIVIFIVERFSRTPWYRNRNSSTFKTWQVTTPNAALTTDDGRN
jgi:hypothetical protein